jgi:hypothetical protein
VIDDEDTGSKAYSFLMIFSAASSASVSEAKSSGVTTLRTLSPPTHSPIRTFGTIAARQCPGLRRYVTIENSERFAMISLGGQTLACYGAMSTQGIAALFGMTANTVAAKIARSAGPR